jgi:F0F1-type ATP synthase membrane subunit b/b'
MIALSKNEKLDGIIKERIEKIPEHLRNAKELKDRLDTLLYFVNRKIAESG